MKSRGIKHIVRSDEVRRTVQLRENDITLATVHSIKGLEAHTVFVVGCTSNNFPCKGSEHPVVDMLKVYEYDKEEEERRLFYVAMSRAKEELYLTYSTKDPTYFITKDMLELLEEKKVKLDSRFKLSKANDTITMLKEWRSELSKQKGVPAYMILHDRTIIDIAVKMPLTSRDLENVMGLGPAKIAQFGEEILNIINLKA